MTSLGVNGRPADDPILRMSEAPNVQVEVLRGGTAPTMAALKA